jgi:hypothetical protein
MRKLVLILAVLAALPVAVFAEWGIGGAAFYKSPVLLGQVPDVTALNVDQFSFGGDLRVTLGWFQVEGLMLYSAGTATTLNVYLDAGVALDVTIVRLSLGIGPNFANNFNAGVPVQAGLNAQAAADIKLGPISFGVSYIMGLNLDDGFAVKTGAGLLGVRVLFWM